MISSVFKDPSLNNEFEKKGYIKVPFLNQEEVSRLKDFYLDNFYNKNEQYNGLENRTFTEFSVINFKSEFKKKCFQEITEICLHPAQHLLDDFEPIIGNFIAKYNEKGLLPIHQNWSVVDETKYSSVSIWCPLQDTTEENGTLYFIDGSHKYFRGNRHTQTHESFSGIHDYLFDEHLKPVPVKAGEAIFLDDAIIHYSPVNQTNQIRLAVQLIMKPKKAQAQFIETDLHDTEKGKIYNADPEFFFAFDEFKANINYKPIGNFEQKKTIYTKETFLRKNKQKKWWNLF